MNLKNHSSRRTVIDVEVQKRGEQALRGDDDPLVIEAVIDLGQDRRMEEDALLVVHPHIPAAEDLDQDRFRPDVVDQGRLPDVMHCQGARRRPMKMTAMLTHPQLYLQHPARNHVAEITMKRAFV